MAVLQHTVIPRRNGPHLLSRWREQGTSHHRLVQAGLGLFVMLLCLDVVLLLQSGRYRRDLARYQAQLPQAETLRAEAVARSEELRLTTAVEVTRRAAMRDASLHLALDAGAGMLYLERGGARLREMPVRIGAPAGAESQGAPSLPRGESRAVVRVLEGDHRWEIPEGVYRARGEPVPVQLELSGALGDPGILLEGGTVIYALPSSGPLSDPRFLLPGSVRAEPGDLAAIRGELRPGLRVYFH